MSRYINSRYAALEAYVPGEQPRDRKYIKLNTNEFPYPPSPDVISAPDDACMRDLRLYPDPEGRRLRAALAENYGVRPENVFLSNGSDEILNFVFMAFCERGAAYADLTYGFYPVFAALHGVKSKIIPLRDDFTVCADDWCGLGMTAVIANPNAPTGISLPLCDIERIVRSNPDNIVLVDEAYIDFGGESAVALTRKYDNLIVCMTYSKSRGMAGSRLGFAIAPAELIADLELIKYSTNPYNIDSLTLVSGEAALTDSSRRYYADRCRAVIATRDTTAAELRRMGAEVLPSDTNFILVRFPGVSGEDIYTGLRRRGILVRHFTTPRIADFNRISIGTPDDMSALVAAVGEIVG